MNKSRPVVVLGLLLIVIALAWGLLAGGRSFSIKRNYSSPGRMRSIVITNGDEDPIIGQVSAQGGVEIDLNDSPSAPSVAAIDAPELPFSFLRDILGVYQPVDWGKTIRVLMYVFGGILLILSNIRRK